MTLIHRFSHAITDELLPRQFTYPFFYTPHPLVVEASQTVLRHVGSISEGKMMGVLVVRESNGKVGFLAAYSGEYDDPDGYFVNPIVDYLNPDGYFKKHEAEISAHNQVISIIENTPELDVLRNELSVLEDKHKAERDAMREVMRANKAVRSKRRSEGDLSPEEEADLIRQSQFEKAEYKRLERKQSEAVDKLKSQLAVWDDQVERLKNERKERSLELQKWLFDQYNMLDANGNRRTLTSIFSETKELMPPSGAGDCCAPRLLQYAYEHELKPLAMGEFWVGPTPTSTLRHHGSFYPACLRKCRPILSHMLGGLDVEPNPLLQRVAGDISILYEDQWLVAVDKPSGLQSVPGLLAVDSVVSRMQEMYPGAFVAAVHRLDQDTSGALLLAKDKDVLSKLQQQFEQREVKKRYEAILECRPSRDSGVISLPIGQDPDDSCRRVVDKLQGKPAVTRYRILSVETDGRCRVEFFPETGRTHQLRIHSAHPEGLNAPIVGDPLYGHVGDRLCLHAVDIQFVHPVTGDVVKISSEIRM